MNEGVGSVSSISVESKENAKTERQAMMARIGTARKYALVEGILIDRVTMRVAVKGPKRTPFVKFNLLSFLLPSSSHPDQIRKNRALIRGPSVLDSQTHFRSLLSSLFLFSSHYFLDFDPT